MFRESRSAYCCLSLREGASWERTVDATLRQTTYAMEQLVGDWTDIFLLSNRIKASADTDIVSIYKLRSETGHRNSARQLLRPCLVN